MVLIIVLHILFASTFTLAKAVLTYIQPLLFIGVRMIVGGIMLLIYYFFIQRKSLYITKKLCIQYTGIILFHIFLPYTCEFMALEYVASSKACIMYNCAPFFTALFAHFLYNERLSTREYCGLIIGFLAFIPLLLAQTTISFVALPSFYDFLLILSVMSSAYGWILLKNLIHKGYSFIVLNGIGMVGGGILSLILSFIYEGWPILKDVSIMPCYSDTSELLFVLGAYSLALIIIANIICYNLYGYLLSHYSPTLLSFSGILTPLFAAFFGWIFLQETVTWHFFCTIFLVMCGLYLFCTKKTYLVNEQGL